MKRGRKPRGSVVGAKPICVKLPVELENRLRFAAWHLRLTLSEIVINGILAEVERLEREKNDGWEFPVPTD